VRQCDVARHRRHVEPLTRLWPGFANSPALVIDGWVEDQLADELSGGGVDDANLEAVDQHQDGGSGVGSSDADVVQPAVVTQGEFAGSIDHIAADPGLRLGAGGCGRVGFGSGLVGGQWGASVQGAVRPSGVVVDR
jgi:hypothetical protein